MRKPRDYQAAQLDEDDRGPFIRVNAFKMGGSWYHPSPSEARKLGERLIQMAEYVEWKRGQGR